MSSPRVRRLWNDYRAMQQLQLESNIIDFSIWGDPPESYSVVFHGEGCQRPICADDVRMQHRHEVQVTFGAQYPRQLPSLRWVTPIFHPNISANGVVCLGGFGTHWTPALSLARLCEMLWDMVRYANFDPQSAYNRDAAEWAKRQPPGRLPLDPRPLRNLGALAAMGQTRSARQPAHAHQAPAWPPEWDRPHVPLAETQTRTNSPPPASPSATAAEHSDRADEVVVLADVVERASEVLFIE